jgi:hypothetical protein
VIRIHRVQFNLRSLLITVGLACVPLALFAAKLHQKQRERAIVAQIRELGAHVTYDWKNQDHAPGPALFRNLLGDDFVCSVSSVRFVGDPVNDTALVAIGALRELRIVTLERTSITDEGLRGLVGLERLVSLGIGGAPNITDAGLEHVGRLHSLESLNLCAHAITDKGLGHLRGLERLHCLGLATTSVTDAGVVHLSRIPALYSVDLRSTKATERGAAELRRMLPQCHVTLRDRAR